MSDEAAEKLYESLCGVGCAFTMLGLPAPVLVVDGPGSLARVNHALARHFGPGWWGGTAPDGGTVLCGVRLVAREPAPAAVEPQCPLGEGAWR